MATKRMSIEEQSVWRAAYGAACVNQYEHKFKYSDHLDACSVIGGCEPADIADAAVHALRRYRVKEDRSIGYDLQVEDETTPDVLPPTARAELSEARPMTVLPTDELAALRAEREKLADLLAGHCGMGPCNRNDCQSWKCQQHRAEVAESTARSTTTLLEKALEKHKDEIEESGTLRDRLAELLKGVAAGLRGAPPPLVMRDWSQLPKRAKLFRQHLMALVQLWRVGAAEVPQAVAAAEDLLRPESATDYVPLPEPKAEPDFDTCLRKLRDGEPYFVLRAQDRCAPATVRDWVHRAKGAGSLPQEKAEQAMTVAVSMETWQREHSTLAKFPD